MLDTLIPTHVSSKVDAQGRIHMTLKPGLLRDVLPEDRVLNVRNGEVVKV